MTDFGQLALPEQLTKAIEKLAFTTPTPIQAQAIPVALEGKDIIGCAQTGTGKTAAFSIPLIVKLAAEHGKDALILAPTRELAQQITDVLRKLVEQLPRLRPAIIIGGASMRIQTQVLRRHPRIIVATPGRLIDHLGSKTLTLDRVAFLVLDEADQMLDMGFAPQLFQILKHLPQTRQTLLFSATVPEKIMDLAKKFLKSPVRITVGENSRPVEAIKQGVVRTTAAKKNDLILDELNARKGSILIFVRTKSRTEKLHKYLTEYGYSVDRIHGGRSQAQRSASLRAFRDGSIRILVATDIAARGLDIPHIEHVINFDLPMAPEDYVHRIGRTARAGRIGEALAILLPEDEDQWRRIQRLITPADKREKTFSRPPVGAGSRRPDVRREYGSERRDERGFGPRKERGFGRGQDARPARAKDRSATVKGERSESLKNTRRSFGNKPQSRPTARGERAQKPQERFDRSQYPQRPFTDKEMTGRHEHERPRQRRFERDEKPRGSFDRDSRPAQRFGRDEERPPRARLNRDGGSDGGLARPARKPLDSGPRKAFGGPRTQRDGDQRRSGPRPGRPQAKGGPRPGFAGRSQRSSF